MEPETSYHTMISRTKARALCHCVRKDWSLPDEQQLRYSGYDWVLVLLSNIDESMRAKLLLLWWRVWHLRNNSIFGDGKCGIQQSSFFLKSYLTSVQDIRHTEILVDPKGKAPLFTLDEIKEHGNDKLTHCWTKPAAGWAKLNFDAGFLEEENTGLWGAMLRDDIGRVLLSAWVCIPRCQSGEAAEAIAAVHSLQAVLAHHHGPIHLENDCLSLISEINGKGCSKSALAGTVTEIKELLGFLTDFVVSKVQRDGNRVAHSLARLGHVELDGQLLIGSVPYWVMDLANDDCNQNFVS
ncbi:unnamed protein product [Alopecurus aequalis]